jgi:hypothetical protein
MVSFQQQWEAAIEAQAPTRPRSPFRHAALLLAIALVLITAPTIALARATDAHTTVHGCKMAQPIPPTIERVCVEGSTRAAVAP